jgi:outer membrane murein-binding lipoprotein Lpp
MQAVVVGLLAWSLKTNVDMKADIAVLQTKVEAMNAAITQVTTDRYRGSDAARDLQGVWSEIARLNTRIERCEAKH